MSKPKPKTPAVVAELTPLCEALSEELGLLSKTVSATQTKMRKVLSDARAGIETRTERINALEEKIRALIDGNRSAFKKPKTRTLGGIRVGLRRKTGKVVYDCDDDTMVARIRDAFGRSAGPYLETKSVPVKDALRNLPEEERKKLGVQIVDDTDEVQVKPAESDARKLAAALLDGGTP